MEIYDYYINKWEKIYVTNPISVRVNDSSIYILSRDRFDIHYKSLHGILAAQELFNMKKLPNVNFSDFIIYGNSALFLDSCSGDIYQLEFLDRNSTNKIQLRSNNNKDQELENRNSSSICHFGDEFFVSESNNWKIRCLDKSFQFKKYHETEPFQANKITANHGFIFATAFRDDSFHHQPPEQANSTVYIPDDQIPDLDFSDFLMSDDFLTTNQINDYESYRKCTENGGLEKMVRFILSSSVLHLQFVNFQKEYILKIKKVLKQLAKFREVVYLVGEIQHKKRIVLFFKIGTIFLVFLLC